MNAGNGRYVILCADDDMDDNLILSQTLRESSEGYELYVVESARGLIDYLYHQGQFSEAEAPAPDLILVDLFFPAFEFPDFLERIEKEPELQCIPVVAMTNTDVNEHLYEYFPYPVTGFVEKPVRLGRLMTLLASAGKCANIPVHER
ncbi:MAG: response regulator [Chloroflexota bacterium]|nr:MAG: response regulator [Chloroflexota bacterium]